jgi:hypothetical protein
VIAVACTVMTRPPPRSWPAGFSPDTPTIVTVTKGQGAAVCSPRT